MAPAFQWTYESASVVSIVALVGIAILIRDARAEQRASLKIANWIWDANRVEQFLQWKRSQWGSEGTETDDRRSGGTAVEESDLLFFDQLQLRGLQAREIETILRGGKRDARLLRDMRALEDGITRRRWRMANNQPTPGISRSTSERPIFGAGTRSTDGFVNERSLPSDDMFGQMGPKKVKNDALALAADEQSRNPSFSANEPANPASEPRAASDGRYFESFAAHRIVALMDPLPAAPAHFVLEGKINGGTYEPYQSRSFDVASAISPQAAARNTP